MRSACRGEGDRGEKGWELRRDKNKLGFWKLDWGKMSKCIIKERGEGGGEF